MTEEHKHSIAAGGVAEPDITDLQDQTHRNDALKDVPSRAQDRIQGEGTDEHAVDGFKADRYEDLRADNCSVLFQDGNCNGGNVAWQPEDGNWWNYPGIGGSASNRSAGSIMAAAPTNPGYDFAAGQTTGTADPIDSVAVPIKGSYSLSLSTGLLNVYARNIENCNCGESGVGTSNYNCYTNCNCNCNCACDCVCACDCQSPCCCVSGDTIILMGDYTYRRIDEVQVGESIMTVTGSEQVSAIDITSVGERPLYVVNGVLNITGDHSFWVTGRGWSSIDPAASDLANNQMLECVIDNEGNTQELLYQGLPHTPHQLKVGDACNGLIIESIEEMEAPSDQPLYTLVTGGHMIADNFIITAWATKETL